MEQRREQIRAMRDQVKELRQSATDMSNAADELEQAIANTNALFERFFEKSRRTDAAAAFKMSIIKDDIKAYITRMQRIKDSFNLMFMSEADGLSHSFSSEGLLFRNFSDLFIILDDVNASLFLDEGMREQALNFLQRMIDLNDGSLDIFALDFSDDIMHRRTVSAIQKLTGSHGHERTRLLTSLDDTVTRTRYHSSINNNADTRILNQDLLQVLRADSEWYASLVSKEGFHAWREENLMMDAHLEDAINAFMLGGFIQGNMMGRTSVLGTGSQTTIQTTAPALKAPVVKHGTASGQTVMRTGTGSVGVQSQNVPSILSNKTFTKDTGKVMNYTSSTRGNNAAAADFNSLSPTNVRVIPKTGVTVGNLPDGRTVNIHPSSTLHGTPTLEIFCRVTKTSIKIRY